MANILPVAVKAAMKANGGVAPVSLLEIQTVSGQRYYWSDAAINAMSLLSAYLPPPTSVYIGSSGGTYSSDDAGGSGLMSISGSGLATEVSLSTSTTVVTTGASITFGAYVLVAGGGSGVPTGTVSFYDGATLLGTVALSSGVATYTTSALLGTVSHSITGVYNGDSTYADSTSGTATLSAGSVGTGSGSLIATVVNLSARVITATPENLITVTATLTPASAGVSAPSGTFAFYDGSTLLGTLAIGSGTNAFALGSTGTVSHAFTVIYSGDSLYATSTSAALAVASSDPTYADFVPWIVTAASFSSYRNTTTTTGSVGVQNVSGDTVQRAANLIFLKQELNNALFIFRFWRADCEYALRTYTGYIADPQIKADGETLTLSLKGQNNWGEISAPNCQIGVACALQFGSAECGSTSETPCNNSYGTCSSTERFKGVVLEWAGASLSYTQYAQPQPIRLTNNVRAY